MAKSVTVGNGGNKSVPTILVGNGGNKIVRQIYIGTPGGNVECFDGLQVTFTQGTQYATGPTENKDCTAVPAFGKAPYTFLWSKGAGSSGIDIFPGREADQTTRIFTSTPPEAADFTVTITDAHGTTASFTAEVSIAGI